MKNKISGFIIALIAIFSFNTAKAQFDCPTIDNTTGCTLSIQVSFFNTSGQCGSGVIYVPTGESNLPCGWCGSDPTSVQVTVLSVGGVNLSPSITAIQTTPINSNSTSAPTSCIAAGTVQIWFNGTANQFVVQP